MLRLPEAVGVSLSSQIVFACAGSERAASMSAIGITMSISQPLVANMDFDLPEQAKTSRTLRPSNEKSFKGGRRGSDTPQPLKHSPETHPAGLEAYRRKLDTFDALSPVYLDALRDSSIPTVSFTLRGLPSPRKHELQPLSPQPLSLPPVSSSRGACGTRHGFKRFKAQRRKEGKASNLSPGKNPELSVDPELRHEAPRIAFAADDFNARHRLRTRTTTALLTGLSHDMTSPRLSDTFDSQLEEVRRNRFFLADKSQGGRGAALMDETEEEKQRQSSLRAKMRRQHKWQLDTSVWLQRRLRGNSRNYFETPQAIERMFEIDWDLAARARRGFIQKLIVQLDDQGVGHDDDGDGVEDEVNDVHDVLANHARMLYSAFEYYAVADTQASNSAGIDAEHDVHDLSLSGFMAMIRDCKLISKEAPAQVMELIFSQVDATDEETAGQDRFNKKRSLNRQEFLQAVIRIALERYVKPKKILDVSDAVQHLCLEDIQARLPEAAVQDSNDFRLKYCYVRQLDKVLRKHLKTLNNIFRRYADLSEGMGDAQQEMLDSTSMVSIREVRHALEELRLETFLV